jgi:hypothetical protein
MQTFSNSYKVLYQQAVDAIIEITGDDCYSIPDKPEVFVGVNDTDYRINHVDRNRFYNIDGYHYDFFSVFTRDPEKFFRIVDWLKSEKCKKVKNPF